MESFSKKLSKKYSLSILLFGLSLLITPLLHYKSPVLIYNIFPFLTFLILVVIIRGKFKILAPVVGLFYILLANIFLNTIIIWPFHFQASHTILSDKHMTEAIFQHQQDALYLFFRLRSLLFNSLIYPYVTLANTANFLSLYNLANIFLIANLYPLTLGVIKLLTNRSASERYFILGSIIITLLAIGFSRSVSEKPSLFLITPLLIYVLLLGLKQINVKWYLILLVLTLAVQVYTLA